MTESKNVIKFYPVTGEVVCYSPEDVAQAGITVFPDSLNEIFGSDAGRRYQEARKLEYVPEETT